MPENQPVGGGTPPAPATPPVVQPTTPQPEITIPKFRFDEVSAKNREYEIKIADLTKQLEATAKFKETNDALQKEIDDLKKSYDLERSSAKKDAAITEAIRDKAIDAEVVKKLIDMNKISFDDKGAVLGLEDQIKGLQESKPFLWNKPAPVAKPSATSPKSGGSFAKELAQGKLDAAKTADKAKNYF